MRCMSLINQHSLMLSCLTLRPSSFLECRNVCSWKTIKYSASYRSLLMKEKRLTGAHWSHVSHATVAKCSKSIPSSHSACLIKKQTIKASTGSSSAPCWLRSWDQIPATILCFSTHCLMFQKLWDSHKSGTSKLPVYSLSAKYAAVKLYPRSIAKPSCSKSFKQSLTAQTFSSTKIWKLKAWLYFCW